MLKNNSKSLILQGGFVAIALAILSLLLSNKELIDGLLFQILSGVLLLSTIIFLFLNPRILMFLLLFSVMFTEFYWIEVLEGYLKPFHIVSLLLFILFTVFRFKRVTSSRIFWLLCCFIIISMISAAFSEDPKDSLRSLVLPMILFSISINVAVMLYAEKVNEETFKKVILYCTLITVAFGILQMFAYALTGTLLTFTETQDGQISIAKRPPSFFTEADTFGKFLCFSYLYLLPLTFDRNDRFKKWFRLSLIFILLGFLLNMTRSALIGATFSSLFYIVYLFRKQSISRNFMLIYGAVTILLMIILPMFFISAKILGSHEEFTYRYRTLLKPSSSFEEDQSIIYRKKGVEKTLEGAIESPKAFLIGHGWGMSVSSEFMWEPTSVGGSLFINILYFSGIFALIIFLLVCIRIINVCVKFLNSQVHQKRRLFSEGILFSFVGMLIVSQLASMWIAPEFWVVIGCAMYLELISQNEDPPRP